MDCAGVVVLARRVRVGLCFLDCPAADSAPNVVGAWLARRVRPLPDLSGCAHHGLGHSHIARDKINGRSSFGFRSFLETVIDEIVQWEFFRPTKQEPTPMQYVFLILLVLCASMLFTIGPAV